MRRIILLVVLIQAFSLVAQEEVKYIGAGETSGFTVRSSTTAHQTKPENTINGSGMNAKEMEAVRLLSQASIAYDEHHVQDVIDMGIEAWVDAQLEMQPNSFAENTERFWHMAMDTFAKYNTEELRDSFELRAPRLGPINYTWWWNAMNHEDLIRQKVAFALSEIYVISTESDLNATGRGLASYYDLLTKNAFGNFRELLNDVTFHPSMGYYLSHLNNPKADESRNTKPDENYAREIMQLFSIGLYELNSNATRKKDSLGDDIPTYDNTDIKELAKVFTGLGGAALSRENIEYFQRKGMEAPAVDFGSDLWSIAMREPMKMYDEWHEPGQKTILKKHVIPSGQTGMKDISDALDILFNHPNVGPFIGKQLIQKLVKSNPTPDYIARVSAVFNDNGAGVRGDLKAVVRAIIMDPEARSCDWKQDSHNGKLREPLLRHVQFMRFIDKKPHPDFFGDNFTNIVTVNQNPLAAPSVFNFFRPDYQPLGALADENLVGPEFQIHNSQTSVGYFNFVHQWTFWDHLNSNGEPFPTKWEDKKVSPDYTALESLTDEQLINRLDMMLVGGRLSDDTRNIIRRALAPMRGWDPMYAERARVACYLIMVSPDYTIQK